MNKQVNRKWIGEGSLAVIYQIDNVMVWYITPKDPMFKSGQSVSMEEVQKTNPYKAAAFSESNIPPGATIDLTFTWSV